MAVSTRREVESCIKDFANLKSQINFSSIFQLGMGKRIS